MNSVGHRGNSLVNKTENRVRCPNNWLILPFILFALFLLLHVHLFFLQLHTHFVFETRLIAYIVQSYLCIKLTNYFSSAKTTLQNYHFTSVSALTFSPTFLVCAWVFPFYTLISSFFSSLFASLVFVLKTCF